MSFKDSLLHRMARLGRLTRTLRHRIDERLRLMVRTCDDR